MKTILIQEVISKNIAFSDEDAEKVYKILSDAIAKGEKIELSFKGIDMLISRFLNVAIGRLYKKFSNWDILDKMIVYKELDFDDEKLLLEMVIPTAKIHFSDIEKNEKIEIEILK